MVTRSLPLVVVALALITAPVAGQSDTTRLRAVPNPRVTSGSWVADPAGHLRPGTRQRLDSIIGALERETSAEMAVVVLDSLDGLEPVDAALLLHRRWGVGKRARDNGIVLLWAPARRQIHVSVGYGLEGVLPDARTGRIQDQHIIPAFRRGDFDAGIVGGVTALAAAAREETYSGLERARAGNRIAVIPSPERNEKLVGGIAGGFLVLLAGLLVAFRRRIPRRCPHGHGFMRRLSESADDAHLKAPELFEERIGSVDYDVWACARCDATRVIPRTKWFSGYVKCPQCQRRTAKEKSKQLAAPTHVSAGMREVTTTCSHCGHRGTRRETIPKLEESAASGGGGFSSGGGGGGGGGGGSSFGGGSAGGGGAGRSY